MFGKVLVGKVGRIVHPFLINDLHFGVGDNPVLDLRRVVLKGIVQREPPDSGYLECQLRVGEVEHE